MPHPPPPLLRPANIVHRPDVHGTVYIDTAAPHHPSPSMPPPPEPRRGSDGPDPHAHAHPHGLDAQSLTAQHLNDVAGVLRRNQACLNCRRRKLKCDAVRPHCGTCVRSHKHLLKTSPGTSAALSCEYDDGAGVMPGGGGEEHALDEEDDGEAAKKKKKSVQTKRRTRREEEEEETEMLRRKIEALEAQLASQPAGQPAPSWAFTNGPSLSGSLPGPSLPGPSLTGPLAAPSPTAFLEMLSSAATTHSASDNPTIPGLRSGASENAMMSTTWAATPTDQSTGLTPFLSFTDNQDAQLASDLARAPPPPPAPPRTASVPSTSSTGDSHPASENLQWPPPPGPSGIEPSTRTEGPWRAVETVETVSSVFVQDAPAAPTAPVDPSGPSVDFNEAMQQQLLLDLFWPGWPPHLPEPNIVNDLVEEFFQVVPNMPRLLHRGRLLSRLALPPTHGNFPHPALIHAVCAAAASWCAPTIYERSTRARWTDNPIANDKTMTFALRQAAYGKEAVQDGLNTGSRLFDVVRAMIILTQVFIDDTRMLECWAYSGLVSRMLLPLGLNVRSAELSLKSVMLPPPADALEREERRITVWMAFYHDTIASAASGWGTSMQLDELTVPLPVGAKDFEAATETTPPNPQDLDSADFWTRHPVPDPFVMVIKAAVLMNRVNRFVRKWKNRHLRDDDDYEGMQRPEFRDLANAAACLQMSFPPSLRNPAQFNGKKLDINLIVAHMLPQAAVICLYEPFADITDPNDGPARRILGAAQSIVSIVQTLATIATDKGSDLSTVMHSSASVCLVTAARTSLLFYRLALNHQDPQTAESHRMDIEMIRTSLQAFGIRFKIGHHHSQLIEYFLDRASRPDYSKLVAHYPTHPRPGAPELHPNSDFGQCILNALNIKRGFWRKWGDIAGNVGISPFGSTPDTAAYVSSAAGQGPPTGGSGTTGSAAGSATDRSARISRASSESPAGPGHAGPGPQGSTGPSPTAALYPGILRDYRHAAAAPPFTASPPTYNHDGYDVEKMFGVFPPNGSGHRLDGNMEALFDGASRVDNGQRAGLAYMKGGGAMRGLTTPNLD